MVSITNSKIFILFIFISLLGHAQVLNVDRENEKVFSFIYWLILKRQTKK
jgi:hypothetical protein